MPFLYRQTIDSSDDGIDINVFFLVLIIQSKTDMIASNEVGKYVHDNITNSELVTLDTNGHCPHLSASDETIEAMKEYLV